MIAVGEHQLVRLLSKAEADTPAPAPISVLDGVKGRELARREPRITLIPAHVHADRFLSREQMEVRADRRAIELEHAQAKAVLVDESLPQCLDPIGQAIAERR